MTLDTLGAFPDERRARIVWAGARKSDPTFARLVDAVRTAAREFATIDEKDGTLHITLARLRERTQPLPRLPFTPRRMEIEEVILFESLPDGQTTRYVALERFTLHASSPSACK